MVKKHELQQMLKELPREEIRHRLGVSDRTLSRMIQAYGLQRKNFGPGRLKKEDVRRIRETYELGGYTQAEIAEHFGVSQPLICKIINNCVHRRDFLIGGQASVRIGYRYGN